MKRFSIVLGILAAAVASPPPGFAEPPPIPAFSADQIMTSGGQRMEGKVYSSGKRIRSEQMMQGNKMVSILDLDQKKAWMLMPPPMGCLEQPLSRDPKRPYAHDDAGSREEKVGADTIDGHPTEKIKVTSQADGKEFVVYQWRAIDLKGLAIKTTDEAGTFELVYRNVELGAPEASLFQPPADCKSMTDMMGTLGAPPPR